MSDAVTNAEIEDVLTSIRRLVSENHQVARREPEGEASDGPLVLTPALRVLDGELAQRRTPREEARLEFLHDGEPEAAQEPPIRLAGEPAEEIAPEVVAETSGIAGEPDPQAGSDEAEGEAVASEDPSEPHGVPEAEVGAGAGAEAEVEAPARVDTEHETGAQAEVEAQAGQGAQDGEAGDTRTPLELRIAELEAVVSASHDEWEPDGSEIAEEVSEVFVLHPERHPAQSAPGAARHEASDDEAQGIEEAELVEEWREEEAEIEPAQAAREATSGADGAPETDGQRGRAPMQGQPGEVLDTLRDEEDFAYLDEEALRDLVLRLIREELQGQMGERITYHVRRMVRREVQKALMIRDME